MTDWLPYHASEDEDHLDITLKSGEHIHQDFKQTISDYHKIARSVAAFANQKGGSLFIGVDDRGKVIGTSPRSEYYKLVDVLEKYCHPLPDVECIVYESEGKEVLEVYVNEGQLKPYAALHQSGKWHIYLRIADTCKKIGSI